MSWNLDRIKVRMAIKDRELITVHMIALKTGVPDCDVAKIIRAGVKIGTLEESDVDHIMDWKEDETQFKTADECDDMKGIKDGITIEAANSREIRIGFGFEAYGETICDRIKIVWNLDETADIFIRHDNPCEDADYYQTHLRVRMDAIDIKDGLWVKGKMNENGTKTSEIRGALE